MMRTVAAAAFALMVTVVVVGCGGGEQPAKVEKPAEPAFKAEVTTIPAMKVASVAKVGSYGEIPKVIGELYATLEKGKTAPAGLTFGLYFDNPAQVKPESCRYEICVQVPPETKNKADKKTGFAIKDAPEMVVAVTEYMGPYEKVGPTYEKLYKWLGENKYVPAGPMIEWYLSDPAKVKPESLQARVGAVVKPAAPPADTTKKAEEPKKEEPTTEKPIRQGR